MPHNQEFVVNPSIHSTPDKILKKTNYTVVLILSRAVISPPDAPLGASPTQWITVYKMRYAGYHVICSSLNQHFMPHACMQQLAELKLNESQISTSRAAGSKTAAQPSAWELADSTESQNENNQPLPRY